MLEAFQQPLDSAFERCNACFEAADILLNGNRRLLPQLRWERGCGVHGPSSYAAWTPASKSHVLQPRERLLRILRVLRVLKLMQYWSEARTLSHALRASRRKIFVFLYVDMILVIIIGALMYLLEGEENGFTSIPRSIYWAIVTLTTVGYRDIAPATDLDQTLAAMVMIIGYGIIVVPTGIVTAERARESHTSLSTQACPECGSEGHDADAVYCKNCGAKL